jgi:phospholipase/carboxylesterase
MAPERGDWDRQRGPAGSDRIDRGAAGAEHRLVLLHGWGADADDLCDLGALLVGPKLSVVALRAPLPHPGGAGRQWYDLQQPGWPQLPAARENLRQRLLALDGELPLTRTALLGFSQGAALALDVATGAGGLPLAGVIGCSGYPHPDWRPGPVGAPGGGPQLPLLLTHGRQDPVVPYAASEALQQQLRDSGREVELIGFAGGHTIDGSLVPTLRRFLDYCWRRAG